MEIDINCKTAFASTGNRDIDPTRKTVVFVHGAGQNRTIWVLPMRYFARKGYNVLAVDLPGHGKSDGPCLPTIEAMSDWLVSVMDAVNVDEATMVGHSMGSLVALSTAALHAARVSAIALVGTSVPMPVSDALLQSSANNDHEAVEMLTYWGHSSGAHLGGNQVPGMWMLGSGLRLMEQAAKGVIHADLKACNDYKSGLEHAAAATCPATLVLGERDMMTPVRSTRTLVDALPNVESLVLPGAGHALLSERPDSVLDALIRIVPK